MPPDPAPTFTCVTCEAEIAGRPTFYVGLAFCCAGCVAGGPCLCSYDTASHDDASHDDEPASPAEPDPLLVQRPELVGAHG